ncbi:hypothetical protein PMZ80_009781 [Knufia obscura]|uniref:Uncharacterized protein n=2 Tax=Knufia TaxID=430999 RepID=A0AAN8ELT6_9EURO|nr:hypothetical protein PMZ80_009781 [Knufia obscura]KAK5949651.1 hypothetical protein OHC33_009248 [Knufia fluminis]
MNTVRSTWYGWGVLCVAGGGAYYFAKQQINADRQARYEQEMKKKNRLARLEASGYASGPSDASPKSKKSAPKAESAASSVRGLDHAGSPSSEISEDAAPVGHAPVDNDQRVRERSKYEGEPYRSKKGDRFS